jgi:hypothetical protein
MVPTVLWEWFPPNKNHFNKRDGLHPSRPIDSERHGGERVSQQDGEILENATFTRALSDLSGPLATSGPIAPVLDGGRDPANGRFTKGNHLAKGNPIGRKTSRFRSQLFKSVTPDDFREIVQQLIERARQGERWAVQLALAYLAGPPEDVTQDRLVMLERAILYAGGREDER